jgi:probable HAF family extracellular repeat protein
MNRIYRLTTVAAALSLAAAASSANSLTALDLGQVFTRGLNNNGQVVGFYYVSPTMTGPTHAFVTGANGQGFTDLGAVASSQNSSAIAINDNGVIAGEIESAAAPGTYSTFVSGNVPNGPVVLGAGRARAVNNNGTIMVTSYPAGNSNFQTQLYTSRAGTYSIGSTIAAGGGGALNDSGTVAGTIPTTAACNCYSLAGIVTGAGSIQPVVKSTGISPSASWVNAINNNGLAVGVMQLGVGVTHGFVSNTTSPADNTLKDIGTLGGSQVYAFDVNDAGWVVGTSTTAAGAQHAFLYSSTSEQMFDLNTLTSLPNGVELTQVAGINDVGQIVAFGSNQHSYLLSPVPEASTTAMWLLGGLAGGVIARRRRAHTA